MKNIIEIKNLNKSFKDIKAVNNISFSIKEGMFFAFLGVNGAGKSTTINMMCGQLDKDSGTIIIDGEDISKDINSIKSKIGVVFQNSFLDSNLTVYDNLESRAALYGYTGQKFKDRFNELAKLLQFEDIIKRPLNKLSGGQKRRIDIARALFHKPKILILDEPTTGLDPKTRRLIWDILFELNKKENLTIFLTTQYMEEAANADYVVIMDEGKIAAEGTPLELKNKYSGDYINIYNIDEKEIQDLGLDYIKIKDGFRFVIPNTKVATELILKYPHIFKDFEINKGKMDDVFLKVTGKNINGGEDK